MGHSLKEILEFPTLEFDLGIVSILGIQMVNILKLVHERFIIYNDIKQNNIFIVFLKKENLIN